MRALALFLASGVIAAQSPEAGRIERTGDEARLIVESGRPLDSAAITLADELHILVDVEDPLPSILAPPGQTLEMSFQTDANGQPRDVQALLEDLRQAASARFGLSYRLDEGEGMRTFVGTRSGAVPLLDRRISIPAGTRMVLEHANLVAQELSKQTDAQIGCCQAVIAGVPWGMEKIWFEARDEPARSVLIRPIHATAGDFIG